MMFAKASILLAIAQLAVATFKQVPFENYIDPRLTPARINQLVKQNTFRPAASGPGGTDPVAQYIELPVNHLDDNSEKFLNRYWVDDYYYQPGGPVFFIDHGEESAAGSETNLRQGATGSLAAEFSGLLILWEHRFYGTSMPAISSDMVFDPDQVARYLRYHTIEQALEDVAVFARQFTFTGLPDQDLKPGNTPWVFVGGSYPGARSAWMRARNPDIFHASLASSAVVQLQENMWQYYRVIEDVLDNRGYANCSSDLRALSKYMDDAFDRQDATAVDNFLLQFTGPPGSPLYRYFNYDNSTDPGEAWTDRRQNLRSMIDIVIEDFQYLGMGGLFGSFCDSLQYEAAGSLTNPSILSSTGVFNDFDTPSALNIVATVYAGLWMSQLEDSQIPPIGYTPASYTGGNGDCSSSRDRDTCLEAITDLSWMWQTCAEFGAFQVTNATNPNSLFPKFTTVDTWIQDYCIRYFGNTVADGPNYRPINEKYGGWNMNPSNVFWVDGELDPWRAVTPNSIEATAPKRQNTQNVPANGQVPAGGSFFGYVVEGGFHCPDLGNVAMKNSTMPVDPQGDPAVGGDVAHTLFINALHEWLPVFQKHEVSNRRTITSADDSGARNDSSGEDDEAGASSMVVSMRRVVFSVLVAVVVYSVV